jgi:hypothetical protein
LPGYSRGNPRSRSPRSDIGDTMVSLSLLGASSLEHYLTDMVRDRVGLLLSHQDDACRWHGVAGSRRQRCWWAPQAQDDGDVWRHGGIDDRPNKDNVLTPVPKMKVATCTPSVLVCVGVR